MPNHTVPAAATGLPCPQKKSSILAPLISAAGLGGQSNAGQYCIPKEKTVMSRREIITNLAATTALPSLPMSSTYPFADFKIVDDALIILVEEWQRCANLCDQADEHLFNIAPWEKAAVPDELFRRPTDMNIFYGFIGKQCRYERYEGRWWYGYDLNYVANFKASKTDTDECKAKTAARVAEIMEAASAWKDEDERRSEAAGYTQAQAIADELQKANRVLRRRILTMPARSIEGLLAKARVHAWCNGDSEQQRVEDLNEKIEAGSANDEDCLASIAIDLIRMVKAA